MLLSEDRTKYQIIIKTKKTLNNATIKIKYNQTLMLLILLITHIQMNSAINYFPTYYYHKTTK